MQRFMYEDGHKVLAKLVQDYGSAQVVRHLYEILKSQPHENEGGMLAGLYMTTHLADQDERIRELERKTGSW